MLESFIYHFTFVNGFSKRASNGFDYFLQSSPRNFPLLLHPNIKLKNTAGINECILAVYFSSFRAVWDHVLALCDEKDEFFTFILFFRYMLSSFHIFKLEAIYYLLDVFLAQPIEHFWGAYRIFCLVSKNNQWQTFSQHALYLFSPQSYDLWIFYNFDSLPSEAAFCESSVFFKRFPFCNCAFVLHSFVFC